VFAGDGVFASFCWRADAVLAGGAGDFRSFFFAAGLVGDDLICEEIPTVREALRRLTPEEVDERNWRLKRASDLNMKGRVLPPDQWTKPEEDKSYLVDHIIKVEREFAERKLFEVNQNK
jgi:ubiquinol-cytochrome c reductase subunit 7